MTDHIHKYKRIDLSKKKDKSYLVYKCTNNCRHYIRLNEALGMQTECWSCSNPTQIDEYHISHEIVKPKCYTCRTGKKVDPDVEKLLEMMKGVK